MTLTVEATQSEHHSVVEAVVTAVAARAGVEPAALTPCLYDVIDPDALEGLFARQQHDSVAVSFAYDDWTVHVEDSVVRVTGASQSTNPAEEHGTVA